MKIALPLGIFLTLLMNAIAVAQPPSNDECTGATVIATVPFGTSCSSSVNANTLNATQSSPNPSCTSAENNDDIWYKFTASSASIIIRFANVTNNATGSRATVGYALYDAPCASGAANIYCSNIGSAGAGYKVFDGLTIGREYYFRFWSTLTGANTASFDFCVQDVQAAPVNDECINAAAVVPQASVTNCTSPIITTTVGATRSLPNPSCSNDFNDDDIWYSFVAATNGIRINFSNARQALGSGNANVGYALYENNCPVAATTFSCSNNIGGGSGSELIGGLTPGNTYYLSLFSVGINSYMTFDFCLVNEIIIANDECTGAINLPVTNGFCNSPVNSSLANATTSAGFGSPACTALSSSEDVWFKAEVPSSGNLVVQTSAVNTKINELVMEAYSGNCGALVLITCDDNGNPDPAPSALHPRIILTGRTSGEVIYFRVLGKGTINAGPFAICAWNPSVLPAVSPGGNCVAANFVTINAANNNQYTWVPVFDNAANIVAEIYADGNDLGTVNTSLFVNTSGTVRDVSGKYYLDRNLTIVPSNNVSAKVRMYFTNKEFLALQVIDPAIISTSILGITKTDTTCQPDFKGVGKAVIVDAAAGYGTDHYIEFSTPSFSSFYLNAAGVVLPLKFISFVIVEKNGITQLEWKVVKDNLIKDFEIEYSDDGHHFNLLDVVKQHEVAVDGNDDWGYNYVDGTKHNAKVYYRVKMNDYTGKSIYSKILSVDLAGRSSDILSVYPNPATDRVFIKANINVLNISATLLNSTGQQIKDFGVLPARNLIELNIDKLNAGMYVLKITDRISNKVYFGKIVKL